MAFEFLDVAWSFIQAHPFIALAILVALTFDFVNGFHDSANAIATVVATKVLTPLQAVTMAGFFNFIGPFLLGTAVAATIGKGIIQTGTIDAELIPGIAFAALAGAIIWDLITWYVGLPTSSSHALVGGLVGAALASVGPSGIVNPTWAEAQEIGKWAVIGLGGGLVLGAFAWAFSRLRLPRLLLAPMIALGAIALVAVHYRANPVHWALERAVLEDVLVLFVMGFIGALIGGVLWSATQQPMSLKLLPGFSIFGLCLSLVLATLLNLMKLGGVTKTLVFMIISPILGFFAGFLLAVAMAWVVQRKHPKTVSAGSKKAQLFSSGFYALTHGTNDAQKTMGIIAVLLIAAGSLSQGGDFHIPGWVIFTAALAMGLGTLLGGWRIVQTMASRITHLTPAQGFAAETGGGVVLVGMAQAGIPVSTTHAISASIMGVGATKRTSAVRWGVGRRIVGAWILTIPASGLVAFLSYYAVTPRMLDWYAANPGVTAAIGGVLILGVVAYLWIVRRGRAAEPGSLADAEI